MLKAATLSAQRRRSDTEVRTAVSHRAHLCGVPPHLPGTELARIVSPSELPGKARSKSAGRAEVSTRERQQFQWEDRQGTSRVLCRVAPINPGLLVPLGDRHCLSLSVGGRIGECSLYHPDTSLSVQTRRPLQLRASCQMDTQNSMASSSKKNSQRSAPMSNESSRNIRQTTEEMRPSNPPHFATRC
jgi:hypothetical protein